MSEGNSVGTIQRLWRGWCGFWFRPADPTPLALMRIVAGLLTLYVHIAYSLDLPAFFGAHAWYERTLAERAFREYPIFTPPLAWEHAADRFQMPTTVELRETLRDFLTNVERMPDGQRVLNFLIDLPPDDEQRLQMIRYFNKLSPDPLERDAELVKMVRADEKDEQTKLLVPKWLLDQTQAARDVRRGDINRFFEALPADPQKRSWLLTMLSIYPPQALVLIRDFANEMVKLYPDPAQRAREWDYIVFWGVPRHWTYTTGHRFYSPFYYVEDPRVLWGVHVLHLVVIVLFTVGYQTRVTSVLTWLAGLAYLHRNPIVLFGQDTMMNLCLFYLMLAPCGAIWSVDALIARYRRAKGALAEGRTPSDPGVVPLVSAGFVIRMLQVHYCFMYLSAGLSKLKGQSWWNGTAPWFTMNNPEFSPVHISWFRDFVSFLCQNRTLFEIYMSAGVIFTLVLEIAFPFCVWTRLRPWFIAGAILLHLMIALNMGLIVFSLFMFTLLLSFMTPEAIRRVFCRPPATLPKVEVQFQSRSEKQRKAASLVYALDVWEQTELRDRPAIARTGAEPVEVAVDGAAQSGSAGLRAALRSLSMTRSAAWLLTPLLGLLVGSWFAGDDVSSKTPRQPVGAH